MIVNFRNAFKKDLRKLKDKKLLTKIQQVIENVEIIVKNLDKDEVPEISNFSKMAGHVNKYRIRLGNYRIGITIANNENDNFDIFWFERFLHRKDIYKYFP